MEHSYILSILYEMALVIGGEVSVKPLLNKVLQRLLYHTSFPAGLVCMQVPSGEADAAGLIEIRIDAAVGDYELAGLVGQTIRLPVRLLRGTAERGEDAALLAALPTESSHYKAYLRLPIDGQGVIVLLSPQLPDSDLPLTQLFQPVMANLAKAILLCRSHDDYAGGLIAARDTSQLALATSEEKFHAISAAVLDALIMVDDTSALVYWNPAAERILGYSAEEALGKSLHVLLTPQRYQSTAIRGFNAFSSSGQGPVIGKTMEIEALHKNGHEIPVELSISALKLNGHWHAVGILRDITQRKHAEQEMRLLAAIVESTDDAILSKSLDGTILTWNAGAEHLYGYSASEVKGQSISLLVPADRPDEIPGLLERIRHGELVKYYETVRVRKDGVHLPISLTVSPLRDAAGRIVGSSAIGRDITERKRAEEELRHSEAGLKEAERIALLGNWELDLVSNALSWSDEIFRIFELDPMLFGATYEAFLNAIHPDDRAMVNQAYTDSVKNRVPYDILHRLLMQDGRIKYVNERCETYYDDTGKPLKSIGTVQDITTRRLAELGMQKSNRALHALSTCNGVLVRATEEAHLLDDICSALVSIGGYQLAWVGFAEHDAGKNVRVVARAGSHIDYLDHIEISWGDNAKGHGPTGTAIRTGEFQVVQDILHDPQFLPWREQAIARGYASSIAFPLFDDYNHAFGAINLYGKEPDAFDADEIKLLHELAGDLAFGIRMLRLREERDHLHQRQQHNDETVKQALAGTIQAIAVTVEKRDPYTAGHQRRVANLSVAIAMELGLSEDRITGLRLGATIHDIGKIYVPAEILTRPGQLTQIEFDFIKTHPQVGYDIMKDVKLPWPVAKMILQHHEHVDGSGYPQGLKGDAILLEARILTVSDVAEAMMSHRPYRPALGLEAALEEIDKYRGSHYDPAVVDVCLRLFREKGFSLSG
ncbi:MAG: PAS domain S-box protein [Nitrosomonadales bacterium]|nr:PAS domain S-box protein [Nitrosomonadales bacterium]